MLSEQSAATVRATLPAVGGALGAITERFYAGLFAARPELLRDLFNRGNQASARSGRRSPVPSPPSRRTCWTIRSSDRTRCCTASPTNTPRSASRPSSTASSTAPVRRHRRGARRRRDARGRRRLGRGLLADGERPDRRREAAVREESGGPGWRTWEVVERVTETADVVTFRLRPADGSPVRDFLAGQYVSVRVALPDGARQIRQYSLSGAAGPRPADQCEARARGRRSRRRGLEPPARARAGRSTSWSCRSRTATWSWTPGPTRPCCWPRRASA